jgi:arginase
MNVQIIQVPYDSGHRSLRMGRGPDHLIENGLVQSLQREGHEVSVETIESPTEFQAEVQTQFALYTSVARHVAAARRNGTFPLVLSGNCGATVGVIAGSQTRQLGVIWFDAHGEFNTPETTTTGFLDGMGLAIATGLCWKKLAESIPGFHPVPGSHILLIGGRDFDEGEKERLEEAGVTVIDAASMERQGIRSSLDSVIPDFLGKVDEVHLHLDLDALNPNEAPANGWLVAGGLSVDEMGEAIHYIKQNREVVSATIASYDPSYDPQGKTLDASLVLIKQILESR